MKNLISILLLFFFMGSLKAKTNTPNKCFEFPVSTFTSPIPIYEVVLMELKRREGFASQPYLDGDMWAIGYGQHYKNWSEVPYYPLNERQATEVVNKSLEKEFRNVAAQFPNLEQNEKWAVTSLTYNVGITTLKEDSIMWTALLQKDIKVLKNRWLENYAATSNHKQSRELEWAIFTKDEATIEKMYANALEVMKARYKSKTDFSYVRMRKK